MKKRIAPTLVALILVLIPVSTTFAKSNFSHELWNQLLTKNVSQEGIVSYEGFKLNQEKFNQYLKLLSNNAPATNWSDQETKAFWINAYNAFTIKLILDNYPIKSIKDLIQNHLNAWEIKFIKIGANTYSLNQIEHEILLKNYKDPRIHFALNCAAISCPKLFNRVYTADELEQQLELMARIYINDIKRNIISSNSVQLSKIFEWYSDDFTQNGTLIAYLNKYSKVKIQENAKTQYLEYDWSLNN